MSTIDNYSDIRDTEPQGVQRLADHVDELHEMREQAEERGFDALIRYIDAALEEVDHS